MRVLESGRLAHIKVKFSFVAMHSYVLLGIAHAMCIFLPGQGSM